MKKALLVWGLFFLCTFVISVTYGVGVVHKFVYQQIQNNFRNEVEYLVNSFDEMVLRHEAGGMLHSVGMISAPIRESVLGDLPPDNLPTLERLQILKDYLKAEVLYLMNASGDVVACTAMEDGNVRTLTGNNYSFRQYFKGAMAGKQMIYPALGVTTLKKGVYYSVPVFGEINDRKVPRGVLVAKFSLQYIEQFLNSIKYPVVIVSPQNVVFSGNVSDWIGKQLNIDIASGAKVYPSASDVEFIPCTFDLTSARCPGKTFDLEAHTIPLPEESGEWHLVLMNDVKNLGLCGACLLYILIVSLIHIIAGFIVYFYYHRRSRKDELLRSESLFRDMFERHSSVMLLVDAKTSHIFKANHSAAKYYGYSEKELTNMRLYQLCVMSEEELRMLIQQVSMNIAHEFDCKHRTREGRVRDVEMRANLVKVNDKDLVFIILNDVTDKKRAEVELVKAKNTAEEAVKIKSEFLANISHEIRTPMNSILGFAELLKQTPLDDSQKDYIQTLANSGELLLDIINDVLNFSKLETGQILIEEIPFNLEFLLEDVFRIIGVKLHTRPIDTYIDIEADVPLNLVGDPTRLRQILVNLLGNSAKFTKTGSIGIGVSLDDETRDSAEPVIRFCVRDTGIGIPKDKQRLIFDAFSQADQTTARQFGGTGLGLAICKKLISALRGSIWVESEAGKGSEFIFKVPFRKGRAAINESIYPVSEKTLGEVRVGIIDDNPVSQKIHKKYCEDIGLRVLFVCASATKALEAMERSFIDDIVPDIVLCDIIMDEMDGYEFVKIIRLDERFRSIRVIAITVDKQVGIARKAQETGFNGFLPKPISRQHLRSVVCTLLGDQRDTPGIVTRHMAEELRLKGVRILVAEGNEKTRNVLKSYFDTLGCYGEFTKSGQELLEKFNDTRFDLCLTELKAPLFGGMEVAKIIRNEHKSHVPILAVTGALSLEERDAGVAAGINDFLISPIDLLSLKRKIMKHTGR